jgi:copper transport protein
VRRAFAAGVALAAMAHVDLASHAALRFSTPMDGAALGDTPSTIQLTLTEKPEPALSEIHVIDQSGIACEIGRPALVTEDPLSLAIAVRRLPTGIYTVNWRVVSAIDGHATTGAYAFGVRQSPAASAASSVTAGVSPLEVIARWVLNIGLVVLIGAAFGDVARFASSRALPLAAAGWLLSTAGLGLLLAAQQRNAGMLLGMMLGTSVGRSFAWRFALLAAAAVGLAVVRQSRRSHARLGAMAAVLFTAFAFVALHVSAGHAAAGPAIPAVETVVQWLHVTASGIWIGGLAALLVEVRAAPSSAAAHAVARFSSVAAVGILGVLFTGGVRALAELTSWRDLTTTMYGKTLLLKLGLVAAIAVFGAANRLRSVPAAGGDLRPLRRLGSAELAFAVAALGAAGLLAALPPPASSQPVPGIRASGADFATTLRASLSAASNQPGPNRFTVRLADYDAGTPVRHADVTLRFMAIDDPAVAATSLTLQEASAGDYVGSAANLAFDGRWRVTVQVRRGSSRVDVPLDVEVIQPPLPVDVQHIPGAVNYNALVRAGGFIRFSLDPERAGRSRLFVGVYDIIQDERDVQHIVVTQTSGAGAARALVLKRLSAGRFAADVYLSAGPNTFAAVANAVDGTRVRARVEIPVPRH